MKRIICCTLVAILLLTAAALAEVPSLSENMFKYAKGTLSCLASGAYDKIVTSVPFSGVSPSADEWAGFAQGGFTDLTGSTPQTKYAVAYWTGSSWKIAVPVSEPSSGSVETLVLISEDGQSVTGYGCSIWSQVCSEYESSSYVSWNSEYNASTSAVVEMDQ
ncbi:MAG: hypothetical protein Q4G06_06300 [Clostridia bacterium]|nr:hypothetical protein [Clostridia bacterium]